MVINGVAGVMARAGPAKGDWQAVHTSRTLTQDVRQREIIVQSNIRDECLFCTCSESDLVSGEIFITPYAWFSRIVPLISHDPV